MSNSRKTKFWLVIAGVFGFWAVVNAIFGMADTRAGLRAFVLIVMFCAIVLTVVDKVIVAFQTASPPTVFRQRGG